MQNICCAGAHEMQCPPVSCNTYIELEGAVLPVQYAYTVAVDTAVNADQTQNLENYNLNSLKPIDECIPCPTSESRSMTLVNSFLKPP